MEPTGAQITDPQAIRHFMFAGEAIFTVVSKQTGDRLTFKVSAPSADMHAEVRFVSVLNGPENGHDYLYVGNVIEHGAFRLTRASKVGADSRAFKVFSWLFDKLEYNPSKLDQIEFWHSGHCGRCGRLLTTPESIASGIGPTCAGLL